MQVDRMNNSDLKEILSWDEYANTEYWWEYEEILRYLEAYSVKEYLARIIKAQREDYTPDKRFIYVLRDEEAVVAFTFFALNECKNNKWDLFIQSIVVNPEYRQNGYGKKLLSMIFANPLEYIGRFPDNVVALVCPWNNASLKLFDSFASFKRRCYKSKFYFIEACYQNVYVSANKYLNQSNCYFGN